MQSAKAESPLAQAGLKIAGFSPSFPIAGITRVNVFPGSLFLQFTSVF